MMDLIAIAAMIAACVYGYRWMAGVFRDSGRGRFAQVAMGVVAANAAWLMVFGLFAASGLIDVEDPSDAPSHEALAQAEEDKAEPDPPSATKQEGATPEPESRPDKSQEAAAAASLPPPEAEATPGLTPEAYADRFNNHMARLDLDLRIDPAVERGSVKDTFSAPVNQQLVVTGTVDKTSGQVESVMMIGQGDGTATSGARLIVVASVALASFNKQADLDAFNGLVTELVSAAQTGDGLAETRRQGVVYGLTLSQQIGAMFSAELAEPDSG